MRTQLPGNSAPSALVISSLSKTLNKLRKTSLLALLLSLFCTGAFAQQKFFKPVSGVNQAARGEKIKTLKNPAFLQLDEEGLRSYLLTAPMEFRNNGRTIPLEIPLPNGKTETFSVVESQVLSPELAKQHPEIKTYTGNGSTNKKSIASFTLTPEGFSALLLNIGGDAVYFEKLAGNVNQNTYFSYFTKDAIKPGILDAPHRFCGTDRLTTGVRNNIKNRPIIGGQPLNNSGASLHTYRLALAATGEFTGHHGGTLSSALASITGYVSRMNAVFTNELNTRFVLVANNNNLIYTNSATDPYTGDNNGAMLTENQTNVDAVIGNANYDIGHVLSYNENFGSGGGVAYSPCLGVDGSKAGGNSIEGDAPYVQLFFDQLLFHEIGHQFSMSHSYNSNIPVCTTRALATSVEPGSGATIMSYGFTCGSDDYLDNSTTIGPILNFHTVNYEQAFDYIASIPSVGVTTATGNTAPTVTMPPAYTIPKSTPFTLTANASDANGDALTFSWEGTNIGLATVPDATVFTDASKPPFFRTYEPANSPSRTYPILSAILDGSNYAPGDKLPSVSFVTTHRLTVRDNRANGGGVSYGEVSVTVDGNVGPFLETTNLGGSYGGNSLQTVTWSVNGTDAATPNVKISLSTDGGLTFPIVLLASTPNDGSQGITLPNNITTTTARVKVEAVGNIFFDISNADFSITPSAVTYDIAASAGANGTITPTGTVNVASGANQTFTIAANPCYQIATVLVDGVNNPAAVTGGSYTFTNVTAAGHTISASFALRTYTITATAGANGTVTPADATVVNCGADQTYTITPNSLYGVQDVLVDGVSVGAVTTYTFSNVTTAHTISASFVFSIVNFTINSSAGPNGSITPNGPVNAPAGSNQTFTITPNACYQIATVLVDGVNNPAAVSSGTYTFSGVAANHTISATFAINTYSITATSGGNGTVTPLGSTPVNCGANQTYTITPASGFAVQNVIVDGASQGAITTYTFNNVTAAGHTISATFVAAAFTITASAGPNGSISPNNTVSVANGANQTFTITPAACYQVSTVLVDGVNNPAAVSNGTYTFTNVTANGHTISASFSLRTYAITATTGANGTVTPAGATPVNCGANRAYTITPASGYTIQSVLVDGVNNPAAVSSGSYTFTNVTATHTISAAFVAVAVSYTITPSAGANGSISPASAVSVASGGSRTFTITPNSCYGIATVLIDGVNNLSAVSSGTYTFTNVTAPHSISATFTRWSYVITSSAGANGTITPNGATNVNCGTSQAYTITPAPGYSVQSVLVDGVSQGAITGYTFNSVTAGHTISASFTTGSPAVSGTLEAELAALSGTTVASNNAGFTGTGFADYTNNTGDYIEWTLTKSSAVQESLSFRYALGGAYARPLKLEINGVVVAASLSFPATNTWTNWANVPFTANLIAGANKIRLTTIGSNGPNVDHLAWQDVIVTSPSTLEAELAALSGAIVASNYAGYTGTGFADYTNNTGDYIEWTLNKPAGATLLKFRYALGGTYARPLKLEINGVVVAASLNFPATSVWTTWSTVQFTANLIAGPNKIRLTTMGSNGPNVDNLSWSVASPKNTITKLPTPTELLLKDLTVIASPNPSVNNFSLFIKSSNNKEKISLVVTDVFGRIIDINNNVIAGKRTEIGSRYKTGTYFLKIIQGDDYKAVKLIKGRN